MHRSRLGAVIIDCRTDDLDTDAQFWGQALGYQAKRYPDPAHANYVLLEAAPNDVRVILQKVDHPSRVHIDIETDDIEAEVRRLEKVGAKRVQQIHTWWVMEAPSGHRFCVVPPQRSEFMAEANKWE